MSHSYDVIKPISKQITCCCGVFIHISNSVNYNPLIDAKVIVKNKVAPFFPDTV